MGAGGRISSNIAKKASELISGEDFTQKITKLRKEASLRKTASSVGEDYIKIEKQTLREQAQKLSKEGNTEGLKEMIDKQSIHNKRMEDARFITENERKIRREDNFHKTVQKPKSLTQQINGVEFTKNKDGEWWSK